MNQQGCSFRGPHRFQRGDFVRKRVIILSLSLIAFILLIVFPQTAAAGVREGIQLCLQTVIPSLFPFSIITALLSASISSFSIGRNSIISKLFGVPNHAAYLIVLGILGGYPIGAQSISTALRQGQLDRKTGARLMGFSNHAGPAFIFGISMTLFQRKDIGWWIWFVQIFSCWIVSLLLRQENGVSTPRNSGPSISVISVLQSSVRTMAVVCGWIILFRVLICYIFKLIGSYLPQV